LDYYSKLNSLTDSSKQSTLLNQIKDSFINLVNLNFIERLADLDLEQGYKIPKVKSEVNNKYEWPELKFNDQCVKKLLNDGDLAMRLQIEENAGDIINVILRLTNSKIENDIANLVIQQSTPITSIDIQKFMRIDHKMDSITVEKYLSVISQDSFKILDKIGDYSGGAYVIDFKKALHNICVSHVESVVRERYGSISLLKVYVVELNTGDVLYVESLSESISINTWVEIEGIDDLTRLKEILCKSLIQGGIESNFVNVDKWINSSESYTEQDENLVLIQNCLKKVKEKYDEKAKMDCMKLLENN
ncbi:unnamed protein product, partial [Brachionus calyciflorus]